MSKVQLYPEALKQIATYAEALTEACKSLPDGGDEIVYLGQIEVKSQYGELLGYLVDEVGGHFMFVGPGWYTEE